LTSEIENSALLKNVKSGAVARSALVSRWTEKQQERAHSIVNDIAEDIDNARTLKVTQQSPGK